MAIVTALSAPVTASPATITLPAIISDHMVLQKSARVPIWGEANPGEEITVTLNNQSAVTKTGVDGRWKIDLNLREMGADPFELHVNGPNSSIIISDVVVGEVWLASGQSNMELLLKDSSDAGKEIESSRNPRLREFHVVHTASRKPLDDCRGKWVVAGPETSGGFSAVGYYFVKRLQHELDVPVGLIHASWGATPAEAWISGDSLDGVPDLKAARDQLWSRKNSQGDVPEPKADVPIFSTQILPPQKTAGYLFNGMINPIIPYAIRGVIWYQGEGNAHRAVQHRTTFPLLINDWRKRWGNADLSFYFCQLANFGKKEAMPSESAWAELRESQNMALKLAHTGQAVLIDLGEADNIHPRNKRDVGERLALIALARNYKKTNAFSGPVYDSMKIEGNRIRITFRDTTGGLVAKSLPVTYDLNTHTRQTAPLIRNSPGSELEGFAICGTDRRWQWANAKIDGNTVLVWLDGITNPVAVRYAWADSPTCNLYNISGLPAPPFRTDDFPLITRDNKY